MARTSVLYYIKIYFLYQTIKHLFVNFTTKWFPYFMASCLECIHGGRLNYQHWIYRNSIHIRKGTYRWISIWTSLWIVRRHWSWRGPSRPWAIASRWLLITIRVSVRRGATRLQQRIKCRRRSWRLRYRLPGKEPRLLRPRWPRLAGKAWPLCVVRIRSFCVSVLAVLVRTGPFTAPVVAGRLAVTRLPRIGRHRHLALCVHDAIRRNAPDGLVGAVLQQSVPWFTMLFRWIVFYVSFATLRLCLRRSHVRLTTAVSAYSLQRSTGSFTLHRNRASDSKIATRTHPSLSNDKLDTNSKRKTDDISFTEAHTSITYLLHWRKRG